MSNSLACCAIFKNESHVIDEWIRHYLNEGVDYFFMIDNGSTDNYKDIIYKYKNHITIFYDDTRYQQKQLYNKYFLGVTKNFNWNIVCDLDEFIYSKNLYKTIKDYLFDLDSSITQVYIPWKIFGSNNFIDQPASVVKNFTKRYDYTDRRICKGMISPGYILTKTICKSIAVKNFDVHRREIHYGEEITSDNKKITSINETSLFQEISEDILAESNLNLNHYVIQSKNWFLKVKSSRGAADRSDQNHIRNIDYFHAYDINEKEDLELAQKLL